MKNFLAIFALTLTISVVSGYGQNAAEKTFVCTNETVEKILSRGIHIGSKLDEVVNLFTLTEEEEEGRVYNNGSGNKNKEIGYITIGMSPKPNDEKFVGIGAYFFDFLDNRLAGFSVSYDKPQWENVSQFAQKMVEIFGLPNVKNWNTQTNDNAFIQCGDYVVSAFSAPNISTSRFGVRDTRLTQILNQRRRKADDEQRERDIKTFKP